ncbi:MAG: M28 family metallopeptidase [Mycobacterium sp.]
MRNTRLRNSTVGAVAVVLTAALAGPVSAAGSGPGAVDTKKLREAVTVSSILKHERQFQAIADANGGIRASGTPGYDASAKYVVKELKAAGYSVKTQEFTFPFSRELAPAELSQVSPTPTDYETETYSYSGSGDVTGEVVPTNDLVIPATPEPSSNSGCEAGDFTAASAGPSIALIQRGSCTFETKVDNAVAAGYDAVIIFNEGNPGRTDLSVGTLGNPKTVPVVGLSYADAVSLYEATQAGPVTARAFTSTESDLNRKTTNIIADSPKAKTDDVVVVGAHLDSVAEGPGINDNGSGSATILEIAKQMAKSNETKKLQRQVRFSFWGAEESGTLGSEHYVANLSDAQRSKIYANLNFDMLGSPNYVRFVYDGDGSDTPDSGPPGSDAIERVFADYFESQGLATEPTAFDGRSDYGAFIAAGIPAGGLFSGAEGEKTAEQAAIYGGTAGQPYDACYHQACDTIKNLSTKALSELGDAAAHATLTLGKSKAGLYPDGSRSAPTPKRAAKATQKGHSLVK